MINHFIEKTMLSRDGQSAYYHILILITIVIYSVLLLSVSKMI